MATTCSHGFSPDACLICRTLGSAQTATPDPSQMIVRGGSNLSSEPVSARPDAVYPPATVHGGRGHWGTVVLVLMGLLAVGAAAWILAGIVLSALHVLELVAIAAGAGWVGYRIGHFRGSRHPRQHR